MKRPFASKRPIGPFATSKSNTPVTIVDLRQKGKADHYDPINWAGKIPNHLFHNTNFRGVEGIMTDEQFSTGDESLNNIFLGATVEERFGDFTFVFDGQDCVDKGFSPRTYLIDEEGKYKESDMQEYYKTNRGVIWDERLVGCYPEQLYSSFNYPNTESRCDPNLSVPFDVYVSQPSAFGLEPTGEIEVNQNPEINLAGVMQQTFVRDIASGPMSIYSLGVSHIMYVDRMQDDLTTHNNEIAEVAASELGVEAISNKEAVDMFPQLTAGKAIYDTEYIT